MPDEQDQAVSPLGCRAGVRYHRRVCSREQQGECRHRCAIGSEGPADRRNTAVTLLGSGLKIPMIACRWGCPGGRGCLHRRGMNPLDSPAEKAHSVSARIAAVAVHGGGPAATADRKPRLQRDCRRYWRCPPCRSRPGQHRARRRGQTSASRHGPHQRQRVAQVPQPRACVPPDQPRCRPSQDRRGGGVPGGKGTAPDVQGVHVGAGTPSAQQQLSGPDTDTHFERLNR